MDGHGEVEESIAGRAFFVTRERACQYKRQIEDTTKLATPVDDEGHDMPPLNSTLIRLMNHL